jgi:hypothetical protein
MRTLLRGVAAALAAGVLTLASGAHAERASCEELLAARAAGQSDAEIGAAYHTTRARLSACERIAADRERLQGQREALAIERAERAEARGQ